MAVFIIFGDAFYSWLYAVPYFEFRFPYIIIFLILYIFLFYEKIKFSFSKSFLVLFIMIIWASLINVYLGNDTFWLFFKQASGILVSSFFFYQLIKFNKYEVKNIFRVYLNVAFMVAVIGVLQEFFFLCRLEPLYNFKNIIPKWTLDYVGSRVFLRVNSIMSEPAALCIALLPALFVATYSIFLKGNPALISKKKSFVIILAFLCSLSIVGYVGFFIMFLLLIYNLKSIRLFFGFIAVIFLTFFFMSNLPYFKLKINETANVIAGKSKIENSNLTTHTLLSNALITGNVLKNNLFIGNGLGSHLLSHRKYLNKIIKIDEVTTPYFAPDLNARDANSLLLRILSETGLLGLCIFFAFIFRFYISQQNDKNGYLWIINNAVVVLFIIRLLRQGHYFSEGFFFFFWIYYFTKKKSLEEKENV